MYQAFRRGVKIFQWGKLGYFGVKIRKENKNECRFNCLRGERITTKTWLI